MSYPAYENCKESGFDWLGEVPKKWQVVDLRRGIKLLTDFEANGSFADVKKNVDLDTDEKYAWYLRATDLENKRIGICEDSRTCDRKAYDYLSKTQLLGGEFLVAKRGEIGKIYVVPDLPCKATLAPNLYLIRLNEKLSPKFAYYWYSSSCGKPELVLANKSTTIGALYKDDVRACKILLPSSEEQVQISNFLDHETAKIDTLIEKQQQLIQLLKEKRQAVISHAVTKGLNPNAPMRDSGVEWLGEVPEHWEVLCIKHIVAIPITDGPHETPDFIDNGIPFVSAEAVSSGKIDFEKIRGHISKEDNEKYSKKYSPKMHDVYMVKSGATTGVTAIVETDMEFNIWSPLAVIRCKANSYPYFVLNFLRSFNFQEAVRLNWSFGTQQNIGMGVIENLHITRPPIDEAKLIAKELAEKCSMYDGIIDKANKQIELSKERRTALISAAVTGKIDVRSWQAPEAFQNNTENDKDEAA